VADTETRLKALEKRARADSERWRMLDADAKASRIIRNCIARAVCAANPAILPIIIKNLQSFEDASRTLNEHEKTIVEVRSAREWFEELEKTFESLRKNKNDDPSLSKGAAPQRRK
jgi:hypothetical protein